ncbi:hypothetical protein I5E68_09715 [Novosphingobium sp. YJ-S2-02]|uniref:Uncharacterized protein n=1 Tax=Novosphingobium aureum TaxID=2792964 RepID=A0A931HCD9_9SPHN|nr:hypothetical protein [Novosphingobium aureum]MBH0113222.1 hypothetical protein [Novosphingobium aureum]
MTECPPHDWKRDLYSTTYRCSRCACRAQEGTSLHADIRSSLVSLPSGDPATDDEPWAWYAGTNDEWYQSGPFVSREEAVTALDGYGGCIVEALPGKLSFSAEVLIGEQYFENDNLFDFENTEPDRKGEPEHVRQADAELQCLLDGWTLRWGHTFVTPTLFRAVRHEEKIPAVNHAVPKACDTSPTGWRCTRSFGHEGPCAAVRIRPREPNDG